MQKQLHPRRKPNRDSARSIIMAQLMSLFLLLLLLSTVTVGTYFLMRWQLTSLFSQFRVSDNVTTQDKVTVPPDRTLSIATRLTIRQVPATPVPPATTAPVLPTRGFATPGPKLAPTATMQVGIVNSAVVNVRNYPSLAGAVVGQINQGEQLNIVAISPDGQWLQVCCPLGTAEGNEQSWVAADLVTVQP